MNDVAKLVHDMLVDDARKLNLKKHIVFTWNRNYTAYISRQENGHYALQKAQDFKSSPKSATVIVKDACILADMILDLIHASGSEAVSLAQAEVRFKHSEECMAKAWDGAEWLRRGLDHTQYVAELGRVRALVDRAVRVMNEVVDVVLPDATAAR